MIVAVMFHVALFAYLKKIEYFSKAVDPYEDEVVYVINTAPPEEVEVAQPQPQTLPDFSDIQDEVIDLDAALVEMKNQDLEIKTSIDNPEVAVSIALPAQAGDITGAIDNLILNTNTDLILEDLGTAVTNNAISPDGQLVLQEGAMLGELIDQTDLIDNQTLLGAGGIANDGVMEGYNSLDSLLSMSNIELAGSKTALPSDLLFEYDSAELKAGARFGLMKLGMLIERNPKMYCLLEGHTDLYGPETYNQKLSQKRAQSVKNYLVQSLKLNGQRILVKGYGKSQPLITDGNQDDQAPNRRVDILMRNKLPAGYNKPAPPKAPRSTAPPASPRHHSPSGRSS